MFVKCHNSPVSLTSFHPAWRVQKDRYRDLDHSIATVVDIYIDGNERGWRAGALTNIHIHKRKRIRTRTRAHTRERTHTHTRIALCTLPEWVGARLIYLFFQIAWNTR